MLKKMIAGILAVSCLFSAVPLNVYAVPSGSAIEEDDDDDYIENRRENNNRRNDDEDERDKPIGEGQFIYAEETSTEATTAAIIVDQSGVSTPEGITANLSLQADGAALVDVKTGTLLYGKHADTKMYPASITKVMTMLVACENADLNDIVTVSAQAVNSIPWDSSKMGLIEGEQHTLSDLLYGLILKSGNDAAVVIAEYVGGSEEEFVKMMNQKAEELGCKNTHFVNPHGYHDEDHYTTPSDMALIVTAAAKNEEVNKIWGSADHSLAATSKQESRIIDHSDKMLQPGSPYYDERVKGGKTGFHDQALNTLVSYAVNGEIELAAVVMKAPGREPTYTDTKALLDYGFNLYDERKLYGRDQFEQALPVIQYYRSEPLDLGQANITLAKDLTAFTPSFINSDTVNVKYDLPEKLIAPVHKDDVLGKITVSYGDMEIGSVDVVSLDDIDEIPEEELDRQRRNEVIAKVFKTLLIVAVVLAVLFTALIFGLRAWFISQRKRKRNGGKKKKLKIKLK